MMNQFRKQKLMSQNNQKTRLLKTKLFNEQLIIKRKLDGPPDAWEPPVSQTAPLDKAVNDWVDSTGNEIVNVSTPGIYMQWTDPERTTRLVMWSIMVTYVPAVKVDALPEKESLNASEIPEHVRSTDIAGSTREWK